MTISHTGAVSKPNNPGFYARHTTARVYTNGYLYDFTLTWEQGGSNLATATGIYTAPASGVTMSIPGTRSQTLSWMICLQRNWG